MTNGTGTREAMDATAANRREFIRGCCAAASMGVFADFSRFGLLNAQATADPKKVTVWITPGATPKDPPTVSPARITLFVKSSSKNPKKIKWECTDKRAKFKVEFASGTPFDKPDYDDTYPESSEPCDDCVGKTYKYSVSVNGGTPLDPQVIIQR